MSANNEIALGLAWIYATLSGDSALMGYAPGGVLRAFAPPGITSPYIVMQYQQGNSSDGVVFGGGRAFSTLEFEVVVVGYANVGQTLVNAATRFDTLLTIATPTAVTGGTIIASYRTQPIESDTIVDKDVVTNIGGIYRIMAKSS